MAIVFVATDNAPKAIGPYSQAILHGDMLFVSGQVAYKPFTDEIDLSSIENETKQVMENIKTIVEAAGMKMNNIVKSSIFLIDMNNFGKINDVYGKYFEKDAPARETVQVARLPKDVNVEISVVAMK